MKTFCYISRDHSGALKEGTVTAEDRSEALGKLKALHLVPVSVTEGVRLTSGPARRFEAIFIKRIVFIVVLVAVATFVIYELAVRQKGNPANTAMKPAAANRSLSAGTGETATNRPVALSSTEKQVLSHMEAVKEIPAPLDVSALKVDTEKIPVPKAVTPEIMSDLRPGKTNSLPSGLSSGTERILNTMFTAQLGGPPPPLLYFPPNEVTNLVNVLSHDIVVFADDDAETVAKKENLAAVKQKLKEYLQQGGHAEDFMAYYREVLNQAYVERMEMQKAYTALRKSGDNRAAAEYFESANKVLIQKGSLPLAAPPVLRRKE